MAERQQQVAAIVRQDPDVEYAISVAGATFISRTTNTGRLFIALKPRDQRKLSAFQVIAAAARLGDPDSRRQRLLPAGAEHLGRRRHFQERVPIHAAERRYGRALRDGAAHDRAFSRACRNCATSRPTCRSPTRSSPSTSTATRRARSASPTTRSAACSTFAFGTRQVATIFTANNQYQVIVEVEPKFQREASRPFAASICARPRASRCRSKPSRRSGARSARCRSTHQQLQPAVTISFNLAPGVALGQAVEAIREARAQRRPADHRRHRLPGHRAGLPATRCANQRAAAARRRDRHLYRARHSLRELHPPDHDPVRPAVGRHRRTAHADPVRHGPDGDRDHRRRDADRHRQEERHHDGGLRHRPQRSRAWRRSRRSARRRSCASGRS